MTGSLRKFVRVMAAAAALLAAAVLAAELYTRTPDDFAYPRLGPGLTADLTLIFHGSKDAANPVFPALRDALLVQPGAVRTVRYVDWAAGADNRPRAAANAIRLGHELGARLAAESQIIALRLITHSSGAFVADSLCRAYREAGGTAEVRMVFLDPFQLRGLLDPGYGSRHHGECADFALAIVNTEDPAPTTNGYLRQAFNLDITADPRRLGLDRNGHYWPPAYMLEEMVKVEPLLFDATHDSYPRGGIRTE